MFLKEIRKYSNAGITKNNRKITTKIDLVKLLSLVDRFILWLCLVDMTVIFKCCDTVPQLFVFRTQWMVVKLVAYGPSREMSHNYHLCKGIFLRILGLCNNVFNFSDPKALNGGLLVSKEVNLGSRAIN